MEDFLVNVFIASRGYLMVAAVLFAVTIKASFEVKKYTRRVAIAIALLGLFVGFTSPSNTPKFTTDYNRTQDNNFIKSSNEARPVAEIQNLAPQPLTAEERAAEEVDMRKRVKSSDATEDQ